MKNPRSRSLSLLLLPLLTLALAVTASAQNGVIDQDNSAKENVSWNMQYFNDFQQDVIVGIAGQLEGFVIKMWPNPAVPLPVAIFYGAGPHPSSAPPAWTGVANGTTTALQEVFVDCSNAGLTFNMNEIFVIRIGDAATFYPGVSLKGNSGWPNPFYPGSFYDAGNPKNTDRLVFRTYVGGCPGKTTKYGTGCPGTGGFVPDLDFFGCASPGENVQLQISNGLGGANCLLLFGLGQGQASLGGGCDLLLSPLLPAPVLLLPLGGSGPGAGVLTLPGALPLNTPTVTVTMQVLVFDPVSPIGGTASNGLQLDIK